MTKQTTVRATDVKVEVRCWSGNVRPWRGEVRWTDSEGRARLWFTGCCASHGSAQRAGSAMAHRILAGFDPHFSK